LWSIYSQQVLLDSLARNELAGLFFAKDVIDRFLYGSLSCPFL
jgi:hypothetical protein